MNRTNKKKSKGFTLIEVLVAGGVSFLLAVTIFSVFIQSKRSLSHAMGMADNVRATRIPLDRLSAYISTGATVPSEDVMLYPPSGAGSLNERGQTVLAADPNTWYRYIILRTTEDFLHPSYDPNEIFTLRATLGGGGGHAELMDAYENDAQRVYDYIIWLEDDTNGIDALPNEDKVLAVARVTPLTVAGAGVGGLVTQFRSTAWATGNPFGDIDPNIPPRIISRRVEDIGFFRDSSALDVSVLSVAQVRAAAGGMIDKQYRASQRIAIPSEVMR